MATSITLRSVKGSALTHAEVDDNFSNLKTTADAALPTATAATTYQPLDGDLTAIAGLSGTSGFLTKTAANTWALDTNTYLTTSTASSTYQTQSGMSSYLTTASAASTYQTLSGMSSYLLSSTATSTYMALAGGTMTGDLTFSGDGRRIIGNFSNATASNRVSFQSSTTNGTTAVNIIPNGTGTVSSLIAFTDSGLTNTSFAQLRAEAATDVRLVSSILGSGTYLPMTFYTGGSERVRIATSGNVGIGTSTPNSKLEVVGTLRLTNTLNASNYGLLSDLGGLYIQSLNSNPMYFATGGSERVCIDSSGNVGIGISVPTSPLHVAGNATVTQQITGGYNDNGTNTAAQALGTYRVVKNTISSNTTFTTTVAAAGATANVIIVSSGTSSCTVTFGTGFKTTGTLATGTTTDMTFVVTFVSDGTNMIETGRTTAMA